MALSSSFEKNVRLEMGLKLLGSSGSRPSFFKERGDGSKLKRWGDSARGKGGVDGVSDEWGERGETGFDELLFGES